MALHRIFINSSTKQIIEAKSPSEAESIISNILEKAYNIGKREAYQECKNLKSSVNSKDDWRGAQGTCDFEPVPSTDWV